MRITGASVSKNVFLPYQKLNGWVEIDLNRYLATRKQNTCSFSSSTYKYAQTIAIFSVYYISKFKSHLAELCHPLTTLLKKITKQSTKIVTTNLNLMLE